MKELVEVRCPFSQKSANGRYMFKCNRIIVQVTPGSSGVAYCRSCKLEFQFEVDNQSIYKPSVVVQHEQNT